MIGYLGLFYVSTKLLIALGHTHMRHKYTNVGIIVISRNQVHVGLQPAHASFKS